MLLKMYVILMVLAIIGFIVALIVVSKKRVSAINKDKAATGGENLPAIKKNYLVAWVFVVFVPMAIIAISFWQLAGLV